MNNQLSRDLQPIPNQNGHFNGGHSNHEAINAKYYWHVLLERRWLVVTSFLAILALGLIYLFKTVPVYEATALIQIEIEEPDILEGTTGYVSDSRLSLIHI